MDRCPLNIEEFILMNISSQLILTERLTRGCDLTCGANAALENLMHPCVRYLLLENIWDGMRWLSETMGPALKPIIEKLIARAGHENKSDYPTRTKEQLQNKQMMDNIKKILAPDIALYEAAVRNYDLQWKKPLMSCNE